MADGDAGDGRTWLQLYRDHPPAALPAFVPLRARPKRPEEASATIELPLGEQSIVVKWPTSDPDGCARFVRVIIGRCQPSWYGCPDALGAQIRSASACALADEFISQLSDKQRHSGYETLVVGHAN